MLLRMAARALSGPALGVVLAVCAALLPVPDSGARAQILDEVLDARIIDLSGDLFDCDGNNPCNLYVRYYGDLDPRLINSPDEPDITGYPTYAKGKYRQDGIRINTSHYPGISSIDDACEAWYAVWTGATDPGLGTYVSYYGAQSTIVNQAESGDPSSVDCVGGREIAVACFGALSSASATASYSVFGRELITPVGGLEPVPVPAVTNFDGEQDFAVSVPAIANQTTINALPSTSFTCPESSTLDDLADRNAPGPLLGVRLYVHIPEREPRSLASMEGAGVTDGVLDAFTNEGHRQLACTGASSCPGVALLPCDAMSPSRCVPGDSQTFRPEGASFRVSRHQINGALGAIGAELFTFENVVRFNTKVVFRGAAPGSTASPDSAELYEPGLVSAFSAHSDAGYLTCHSGDADGDGFTDCQGDCDDMDAGVYPGAQEICDRQRNDCNTPYWPAPPATEIVDGDGVAECEGNRVSVTSSVQPGRIVLEIQAEGDFLEILVERSRDGRSFTRLATVSPPTDEILTFVDTPARRRGRRLTAATLTYRVIGVDVAGVETEALERVSLARGRPGLR